MPNRSVFDPTFQQLVHDWLTANDELYVVIRYAYAGGSRAYLFIHAFDQFQHLLTTLPPQADVLVFRQPQLPLRGQANEDLLQRALAIIPDGSEWMVVRLDERHTIDMRPTFGDTHEELQAAICAHWSEMIGVGLEPDWSAADHADLQSALVPLSDGTVGPGAY